MNEMVGFLIAIIVCMVLCVLSFGAGKEHLLGQINKRYDACFQQFNDAEKCHDIVMDGAK